MGNRAVVVFKENATERDLGVYLHWNGGVDSIVAFLDVLVEYGALNDPHYAPARFVQLVGNFFGGVHSLAIDNVENLDTKNGDNGVFFVALESATKYKLFNQPEGKLRGPRSRIVLDTIRKNSHYFKKETPEDKNILDLIREANDASFKKE